MNYRCIIQHPCTAMLTITCLVLHLWFSRIGCWFRRYIFVFVSSSIICVAIEIVHSETEISQTLTCLLRLANCESFCIFTLSAKVTLWCFVLKFYKDSTTHYIDVIMPSVASPITSLTIVYPIVYSGTDQRKHQSSASLAFVRRIHRDRWIPRTKGQLHGKCFHLMTSSCKIIFFLQANYLLRGFSLRRVWNRVSIFTLANGCDFVVETCSSDILHSDNFCFNTTKWTKVFAKCLFLFSLLISFVAAVVNEIHMVYTNG